MLDTVIRGGLVVDGTGAAARRADVGIRDGRIVSCGSVTETGAAEIDARGLLVTPGFVDIHTHYDGQIVWDPYLSPSCLHGVTTVVMGNCGVGFAPVRPAERDWLIRLMEGVEDIPGTVLAEGIQWQWESFPEYLDVLRGRRFALDVATQLPHGPLRIWVMGERGADPTVQPSAAEIAEMGELVREALHLGALGFSTSRTTAHRSSDGKPTPSLSAQPAELLGIARAMRASGRGIFEIVSDFRPLEDEFELIRRIAAECGRPVSVALTQTPDQPDAWRRILELIARGARRRARHPCAGGGAADQRAHGVVEPREFPGGLGFVPRARRIAARGSGGASRRAGDQATHPRGPRPVAAPLAHAVRLEQHLPFRFRDALPAGA